MSDEPRVESEGSVKSPALNYASPHTPRPDRTARLVIGLLIAFLALAAGFVAIVIYESRVG